MVAPPGVSEAAQVDVGRADQLVPVPRPLFLSILRGVSHPDLDLQSLLPQVPVVSDKGSSDTYNCPQSNLCEFSLTTQWILNK